MQRSVLQTCFAVQISAHSTWMCISAKELYAKYTLRCLTCRNEDVRHVRAHGLLSSQLIDKGLLNFVLQSVTSEKHNAQSHKACTGVSFYLLERA
jgi:hypothetical protein